MSLKDERMKIMNEVLSGIKVLMLTLKVAFVTLTAGYIDCIHQQLNYDVCQADCKHSRQCFDSTAGWVAGGHSACNSWF